MSAEQPQGEADARAVEAELATDAELFEQVLNETLLAADANEPMDGAELQLLLQVARQHLRQTLSLDPVVIELVQSIVGYRFGRRLGQEQDMEPMSRRIAETLWEDPNAHGRLESLWARLFEAVQ